MASIVFHKDPASLQPPAIPSTHHLFSTSFRAAKMSQYRFDYYLNADPYNFANCQNTTNFSNNTAIFNNNNVLYRTVADDRSDILAWLSPLEPGLRHRDIQEYRVGDVGEWVLETEEFRSWYAGSGRSESDNAVLFCYGDPGVGKTFIR